MKRLSGAAAALTEMNADMFNCYIFSWNEGSKSIHNVVGGYRHIFEGDAAEAVALHNLAGGVCSVADECSVLHVTRHTSHVKHHLMTTPLTSGALGRCRILSSTGTMRRCGSYNAITIANSSSGSAAHEIHTLEAAALSL